jgi:hypothetical protein
MFQRKPRRFSRYRSNDRGHPSRSNGLAQTRSRPNNFSNNQNRNNFRQTQSAEKLLDKYNTLAKEAMVSGDKTLAENYFQHADHFMRVVEDKNKNKVETKISSISELPVDEKAKLENNVIKQEESVKNNKE